MARPSTSERYPQSLCRDATRQSKAEPLDAERRSIGAGRLPSNGAPQGNQGRRGQGPEHGTAWQTHRLQSSRCHRGPGPLSTLMRLVPGTKQNGGARFGELSPQVHYPNRRVITPAGPAPRCAWRERSIDRLRQGVKLPKYPLAESLDSTKASGATVGDHN